MSVILATAGYDHKIRFWEAPSGICSRILKHPHSQVNKLEITPDKQFLAAGGNPHIRLYEIDGASGTTGNVNNNNNNNTASTDHDHHGNQSNPVLTLEGHTSNVTSLGFQRDGRFLYSSSEDGTIKLWDLRNPTYSRSFDGKASVRSVTLRQDRDEIISGDADGKVTVWDIAGNGRRKNGHTSNGCIYQVQPGKGSTGGCLIQTAIQAVDISEDSRTFVAVSNHGTVYVWDPINTTERSTTMGMMEENEEEQGNNNDGDGGTSFLSNPPLVKFRAHPPGSYCLHARISPDCRHLCTTGSDGSARLWDTTTWELSHNLRAHTKWVWDSAFCADSSYLVTASSDTTARLWNLGTGDVVRQYHGHKGPVTCVALNDSSV
ncbi:WD40 repeat-containing protein [Nitzschia inconspicua]|uniref:WD40 repeat-containing protein n=1 Tax=Nitzschia inconspicua TaxID=303405 RepID=A0A9K3PYB9_9STRA|nr:WD40 repeat-containing protein [Nitzschia inconspicua]